MSFAALIPDRRRPPAPQQEGPGKPGRWTLLVLVLATMAGGLMIVLLGG
jgi:hypothetical protein